jgi:hypothetical protein
VPIVDDLKLFDVDSAEVSLWVFRGPRGLASEAPSYTARWVETTNEVDGVLKEIVKAERDRITEDPPYDLLSQTNESSGLTLEANRTHAALLTGLVSAATANRRAENAQKLNNTNFYLIKLSLDDKVVYAVRRTSSSWQTKRSISARTFVFMDDRLAVENNPSFEIAKSIDFFILADELLILDKGNFESTLRYKQAHAADFLALQREPDFIGIFVDIAPIVQYVGVNKIQLRGMCAIREREHYRNVNFMNRVRTHQAKYGLVFKFDSQGRIIATPETAALIINTLLDHRLFSEFSDTIYDVPSTTPVFI